MVQSVVINFSRKILLQKFTKRVIFVMYLTLGSHILSRSIEADILESNKGSISCPEVWRPIFWKVKRIYILSRSMEADILESKRDLYLVQKYGGRYFGK